MLGSTPKAPLKHSIKCDRSVKPARRLLLSRYARCFYGSPSRPIARLGIAVRAPQRASLLTAPMRGRTGSGDRTYGVKLSGHGTHASYVPVRPKWPARCWRSARREDWPSGPHWSQSNQSAISPNARRGVMPKALLKLRPKWERSLKPQSNAASVTDRQRFSVSRE